MPSRLKDASAVNKIILTVLDVHLPSGTNPYVEHGPLVPDVVPSDHGTDTNSLRVKFATRSFEISQHERPFYEWTDVDFSAPC